MASGHVWTDRYGQPLQKSLLKQEIAAASYGSPRSIQSGHPAQGMDPSRLGSILRAAETGDAVAYFELAEEMEEKDLHYLSVLGTRKRAVSQLDITVEAAGDEQIYQDDAELIRNWLDRDMLEAELFDILDAIGKGVSAVEIVWEFTAKSWLPERLEWRDPRWFEFDRETGQRLMLRGEDGPKPLPFAKFIEHRHPAKSGLPIRGGLARAAAWGYMFKNYAIRDWVAFLEGYGHPLRVGKYGPNESEENKRLLLQALLDLGVDAAAAFPETMSVEFVDRKAGTAPNDLWRSKAEYIDLQMSKAVLGQTNTTDAQAGGLGSGQAEVHNDVRGDIERADAKLEAATLNRDLIRPMVILNHGIRDKYPRLKIGRPDEFDAAQDIANAEKLAKQGARISMRGMMERSGLPEAEDGEEIFGAPTTAQDGQEAKNGGTIPKTFRKGLLDPLKSGSEANDDDAVAASRQERMREPDGIELAAEEALSDWEELIEPAIAPIEGMIADAASLEEVRERLAGEIEAMDVTAFREMLAQSTFGSRLLGDIEARGKE